MSSKTDADVFREAIAKQGREIAMLRARFNEVLAENAARDTFVRWFSTEYANHTYGRRGEEMAPGRVGVGRCLGWFGKLIGRSE